MKQRASFTALVLAVACAALPASAAAITNGQPDFGRHPYVGALVSYDPATGDKYLTCSGTLVTPTVFLTAAHCLVDEPGDQYVSFDPFVGAPDVGPGVKLYHGVAHADARFVDETLPGDTHDLAVVVLDKPVKGLTPAVLPPIGLMDHLRLDHKDFPVVGYGREGHDASGFFGGGSRRTAVSSFLELEPAKLDLSQRVADGDGGSCRGDSGGPVFLGRSRTLVAVTSDGDENCVSDSINYRVDTRSAASFLGAYLKLPAKAAR